jgi:hypothetical protein
MGRGPAANHHPTIPNVLNAEAGKMKESPTLFQLRFQSLFDPGRGFAFPCDQDGRVDMDALSERARNNYLYARAMIGREVANPSVCPTVH